MKSILKAKPMAKTSPADFVQQVRQEANKVTWPTRKEVGITTLMVLIMVVIAAIFFFGVDSLVRGLIQLLLSVRA